MPKGPRKTKGGTSRKQAQHNTVSDFTLYDYANSEPGSTNTGRIAKGTINNWSTEVKQMEGKSAELEEALAWYEKDLSDFELTDTEDQASSAEDEDEEKEKNTASPRHVNQKKGKTTPLKDETLGRVYPLDLWFLIGDWIHPEEVSVFARICQGSHFVTHSARFWFSIYERSFEPAASLPLTLQAQSISRVHGLRARVMRALFIMYAPFQQRLRNRVSFENDPDYLKGATCILMWYQKLKSVWNFYFKFNLPQAKSSCCITQSHQRRGKKLRTLQRDVDIYHNPEEGCCVLQIVTQNYTPLPPTAMGQMLARTSLSVSHGMCHHKMKLMFAPQQYMLSGRGNSISDGITIIMDPVLNAHVLHWWEPKYPHQPV